MDAGRQRPARPQHRPGRSPGPRRAASPTSSCCPTTASPSRRCPSGCPPTPTTSTTAPPASCAPRPPGVATVTIARRTGRPTKRIWQGPLGPGAVKVNVDPKRLGLGDGVYVVVARFTPADGSGDTEQRRRVIFDRTLSALTARPSTTGAGQPRQGPAGRRLPPAAAGPRHREGAVVLGRPRSPRSRATASSARGARRWCGTACAASRWSRAPCRSRSRRAAASAPRAWCGQRTLKPPQRRP